MPAGPFQLSWAVFPEQPCCSSRPAVSICSTFVDFSVISNERTIRQAITGCRCADAGGPNALKPNRPVRQVIGSVSLWSSCRQGCKLANLWIKVNTSPGFMMATACSLSNEPQNNMSLHGNVSLLWYSVPPLIYFFSADIWKTLVWSTLALIQHVICMFKYWWICLGWKSRINQSHSMKSIHACKDLHFCSFSTFDTWAHGISETSRLSYGRTC